MATTVSTFKFLYNMKRQIRCGVFETNSSSTHAVAILNEEEFKKYELGEILMSRYGDLISEEDLEQKEKDVEEKAIETIKKSWGDPISWNYQRLHRDYETLEDAIKHVKDTSIYESIMDDLTYNYLTDEMETEYAKRELNGTTVYAVSIYGCE